MKILVMFLFSVAIIRSLNGCSGNEEAVVEDVPDVVVETPSSVECTDQSISNFNQFLGLGYGDDEILLQSKLGKFTGADYTPDSSTFIYYYNRIDRVPISVWVNRETSRINTVFMEVISLEENFEADLEEAVEEFSIDPCEANWFGLSAESIKAKLGEPDEEAVSSEGITLLTYDSDDFLITVAFKIYDQQSGKCSSVSVNWFYE